MKFFEDEVVEEVRRTRKKLLEEYGSMEALNRHLKEERPRWEQEGWVYVSMEEARRKRTEAAETGTGSFEEGTGTVSNSSLNKHQQDKC